MHYVRRVAVASDDLKWHVETRKTPYVMHPEELCHSKDHACISQRIVRVIKIM